MEVERTDNVGLMVELFTNGPRRADEVLLDLCALNMYVIYIVRHRCDVGGNWEGTKSSPRDRGNDFRLFLVDLISDRKWPGRNFSDGISNSVAVSQVTRASREGVLAPGGIPLHSGRGRKTLSASFRPGGGL